MRSVITKVLVAGFMVASSPNVFPQATPKTPIKVVGGSIEFQAENAAGWKQVACSISGAAAQCWEAQLNDIPICVETDGTVIPSGKNWSCDSGDPLTLTANWSLTLTEQDQ